MSIKFRIFLLFFIFLEFNSLCYGNETAAFYRERGIIEFNNEMYSFALESFTKAVRIDQKDAVSYNYLAQISLHNRNRMQALEYYRTSLNINRDQDEILFKAAELYDYYGNQNDALKMFEEAVELNPENNLALIGAARIYSMQNKIKKSSDLFQKAFDLKISESAPLYNRGKDFIKKNDFENAAEAMNQCIKVNPAHLDAYYDLAQFYRYRGKNIEALKLYDKIKFLQPHLEKPYVQIAYIYYTVRLSSSYLKQIQLAEKNIKKAISINDKNADYWEFLSELYTAMNMYEESKKAGNTAFRLNREQK
ncbi:MAG: tetratricopeptide repeat protein [Spirochaetes bacterium]|nr:tetratricopeptide repeat protein [Spirochaetota bacterium]